MAMLGQAHSLRADVITPTGQPAMIGVTITRFENGQLTWRGPDGTEVSRPIDEITYLQIAGWQDLNTAERQLRENHPRQAVATYQKALADLDSAAPRPAVAAGTQLDLRTLARSRLLRAAEADGQHETAVGVYIQLLEGPQGAAMRLLQPRRTPEAGSPQFAAAAKLLAAAIERHGDDAVGRVLREWRQTWPGSTTAPAPPAAVVVQKTEPALSPAFTRLQGLNREGRFHESLATLRDLHDKTSGPERAEVYYWEGQTRLARAAAVTSDSRADRRRAGVAFMRVVVHFPDSPRAPEALCLAARICQEDGLAQQARALWSEAITRYPAANAFVQQARRELDRLAAASRSADAAASSQRSPASPAAAAVPAGGGSR